MVVEVVLVTRSEPNVGGVMSISSVGLRCKQEDGTPADSTSVVTTLVQQRASRDAHKADVVRFIPCRDGGLP